MSDVYIAPLFIAVAASSEGEACDAFSETLRTLMIAGDILDWSYAKEGQGYGGPILTGLTLDEGNDEDIDKERAYRAARPGYVSALSKLVTAPAEPPLREYQVTFYIDGDYAVETFTETVQAANTTEAWDKALQKAKDEGGSSSGRTIHEEMWDNATEIVTTDLTAIREEAIKAAFCGL